MQTCANHMVTIGDDGQVLVTSLWKFARVKKFDINTQCLEDMLFTERPNIRRKLKSLGYFEPQAMALVSSLHLWIKFFSNLYYRYHNPTILLYD